MSIRDLALSRRGVLKTTDVPMPEWGEGTTVRLREMSAAARDAFDNEQSEAYKAGATDDTTFRARLVTHCAVDEAGGRAFTAADLPALTEMPATELRRLFDAAAKLNGIGAAEEKALEKNS